MKESILAVVFFVSGISGVLAAGLSQAWSNVPPAPYWLRMYPIRQYGAFWTLNLEVSDFVKSREKAMKIIDKGGGKYLVSPKLMASSEKHGFQQLSVRLEKAKAQKIIDKLKKLGKVQSLIQRDDAIPQIETEARSKLKRLRTEREAGKATIDRFGSTAAAIDELIEHLDQVDKAYAASEENILFNMTISGAVN